MDFDDEDDFNEDDDHEDDDDDVDVYDDDDNKVQPSGLGPIQQYRALRQGRRQCWKPKVGKVQNMWIYGGLNLENMDLRGTKRLGSSY